MPKISHTLCLLQNCLLYDSPRLIHSPITSLSPPRFLPRLSQLSRTQLPTPHHQIRPASTAAPFSGLGKREAKGLRISHLFGGLVGVGMLVTIYGLLEWYFSLATWPEPVRTPLKAALKCRNRGDIERAESYFRKAIDAARSLPPSALSPDPLLKLSGIYISLSSMLETDGQPVKAYLALSEALSYFGPDPLAANPAPPTGWIAAEIDSSEAGPGGTTLGSKKYELTREDVTRAIGLSQKLGQLALQLATMPRPPSYPRLSSSDNKSLKSWDEGAENYLSSALTAMLRLGLPSRTSTTSATPTSPVIAGRDVDLPRGEPTASDGAEGKDDVGRVDIRGLGMTMESLAEVYARKGQYDLAGQLLIQAVSTLLPPKSEGQVSVADRCRAALLMTTISSHALEARTNQAIKSSKSWSLQSLQIADATLAESGFQTSSAPADSAVAVCARAKSVGLYNLGMLAEMENDKAEAIRRFHQALASARDIGFGEGKREASEALRRLQSNEINKA